MKSLVPSIKALFWSAAALTTSACDVTSCTRYASNYPCLYVEKFADYDVWYWRNVEKDNEADNVYIGKAVGLQMCEDNARAFAGAVGEEFNYRAYICVLKKDGRAKEKHRLYG